MGKCRVPLVGESHYQENTRNLKVGQPVHLGSQHSNSFDPSAVRYAGYHGATIGYLAREDWSYRAFNEGTKVSACVAEIIGGTRSKPTRGVVLEVFTAADAEARAAASTPLQN